MELGVLAAWTDLPMLFYRASATNAMLGSGSVTAWY
jgi:hypothetical protein